MYKYSQWKEFREIIDVIINGILIQKVKCLLCLMVWANIGSFKNHFKSCHCSNEKSDTVTKTPKSNKNAVIQRASKSRILKRGDFQCNICKRNLPSEFDLKKHVNWSKLTIPLHCPSCNKKFEYWCEFQSKDHKCDQYKQFRLKCN